MFDEGRFCCSSHQIVKALEPLLRGRDVVQERVATHNALF